MLVKLTALILATLALMLANLCLGDVAVEPLNALHAVLDGLTQTRPDAALANQSWQTIILEIRLPRLLSAFLTGLALAVSGYLLQSVSRNDLADPYLTGVSSGAALGVAAGILGRLDFQVIPLMAFAGGLLASLLTAYLARSGRGLSVSKLLLSGVALSAVASALINLAMALFGSQPMAQGLNMWMLGGLSGRGWPELGSGALYILLGLAIALLSAKQLRLLSLGEEAAQSLGLSVAKAQGAVLGAAVLLAGTAVALAGLVGFVGLVAPHAARRIAAGERTQILAAALSGACLVLLSDLLARTSAGSQELPLGTLMALIGGPFFIYLLSRTMEKVR